MPEWDAASFLDALAPSPECRVKLPVNHFENHSPELFEGLRAQGFLVPDARPQYIDYFGETCALHYLDNPYGKTTICFQEEEGTFHTIREELCRGWEITYSPLTELIHTSLSCRGRIEEVIPGFLWKTGLATRQSREVWLCRNCAACIEQLKELPKSALLFSFGTYGSAQPAPHTFKLFNFITAKNGQLTLDADSVLAALDEEIAAQSGSKGATPAYDKQKNAQKSIESWLWMWLNSRLKAAKIIVSGDTEEDVCKEWAHYEVISQKQICQELNITPMMYTRTKEAWEKDKAGYGQFFLLVNAEFVKRRPRRYSGESTAVVRLNEFYHAHRKVIEKLRRNPPSIV